MLYWFISFAGGMDGFDPFPYLTSFGEYFIACLWGIPVWYVLLFGAYHTNILNRYNLGGQEWAPFGLITLVVGPVFAVFWKWILLAALTVFLLLKFVQIVKGRDGRNTRWHETMYGWVWLPKITKLKLQIVKTDKDQ